MQTKVVRIKNQKAISKKSLDFSNRVGLIVGKTEKEDIDPFTQKVEKIQYRKVLVGKKIFDFPLTSLEPV